MSPYEKAQEQVHKQEKRFREQCAWARENGYLFVQLSPRRYLVIELGGCCVSDPDGHMGGPVPYRSGTVVYGPKSYRDCHTWIQEQTRYPRGEAEK